MRHISIGSIKEIRNGENLIFKVSLLKGEIVSLFENRSDALDFMKVHAEGIINTRKIDAICVEYINVKAQKHYLMIDTLMNGPDERFKNPSIHEQTNYEYRKSHPVYFRRHSTRRIINERSYSFSDILRASINWKPQFSIWLGLCIISLFIVSAIFAITTLGFVTDVSKTTTSSLTSKPLHEIKVDKILMVFIFAIVWIVGITTFSTIIVSYKRYLKHAKTQDDINWHKWYKQRVTLFNISNLLIIVAIVLFALFYKDLADQDFFNEKKFPMVTSVDQRWVIGTSLTLIVLLVSLFVGQFVMVLAAEIIKFHKLRVLFGKEDRKPFHKWLMNNKKYPELKRDDLSIFLFDPEYSKYAAMEEITASREIMAAATREEIRLYKKKAKSNKKRAMEAYLDRIKRAENYMA